MHSRDTIRREKPGESSQRTNRRRRKGALGGLTGLLVLVLMALSAPSASAQTWECDAFGYLFQTYPEGTNSTIVKVDLATGDQIGGPTTPEPVNAVGFNPVDSYFWGMMMNNTTKAWQLVKIHADGSVDEFGVPTGPGGTVDATVGYPIGEVDPNGHYWLANGTTWYEIDLNQTPPVVLRSGSMAEAREPAGLTGVGNDWSWINGQLYSFGNTADGKYHLVRFDPATEKFAIVGEIPVSGFGASFADASGYVYGSQNATNKIYRIDPNTLETIEASKPLPGQPQSSPGNDGARCASAPIPTVTVVKTVEGRVRPADQFTVGLLKPDGSTAETKTTSGSQTTVSTTNFPASEGKTYTVTDAMAAGSPTPLNQYVLSIVCTNGAGAVVPTGGSGPNWSLLIAEPTDYTCNVTNKAEADLSLEKSSAPTPVVPGEEATFTLKVTNKGPSASIGETITDQLPKEFKFVSASQGCAEANGVVTCQVGELAPGASRTFEVKGKVASSLDQCLENTATVSGVHDPNPADNSATDCAPIEGRIDLSIKKTPSHETVAAGGQVIYTLVIENDGPSDATGVKVTDPLAANLTLVSANPSQGKCPAAGNMVSCDLGYLAAGGSAQILVTATTALKTAVITNTATVRGDQVETNPDNNQDSATVNVPIGPPPPAFDLVTVKKANPARATVGERVRFRIVVTNRGPAAAPGVQFTDTLNAPADRVSVKPSAGSCQKGLPLKCDLGTIAAGEKVTIKVVLKPLRPGCFQRNAASTTGAGTDLSPQNNLDVVKLCVKKVKLKLTKTASRSSVPAGGNLGYTIRVDNLTKGVAKNVRVCDILPKGMAFLSSSPKGRLSNGQLCWRIKQLGPKASKSFRVVARALKGSSGRKVNRVTATGPDSVKAKGRTAVRVTGAGASPAGGVTG